MHKACVCGVLLGIPLHAVICDSHVPYMCSFKCAYLHPLVEHAPSEHNRHCGIELCAFSLGCSCIGKGLCYENIAAALT